MDRYDSSWRTDFPEVRLEESRVRGGWGGSKKKVAFCSVNEQAHEVYIYPCEIMFYRVD